MPEGIPPDRRTGTYHSGSCDCNGLLAKGLGLLGRTRFGRVRLIAHTLVDLVPVLLISQVNFKVGGGHLRSRRVQLAGAVGAPNPGKEHPLDILGCWLARLYLWRRDDDYLRVCVHSAVSHRRFKGVMGPGLSQIGKGGYQPLWGRRL